MDVRKTDGLTVTYTVLQVEEEIARIMEDTGACRETALGHLLTRTLEREDVAQVTFVKPDSEAEVRHQIARLFEDRCFPGRFGS